MVSGERGGLVVNASDSGSRGREFEPHSGQTVLCPLARHIYSPKLLVIPRKRWLRPNMTEKLFTGTLRINQPTNHYGFDGRALVLTAPVHGHCLPFCFREVTGYYMSLVVRKPVFGVSAQVRHNPGCTATEDG